MLKDIFKLCKTYNINYSKDEFICNGKRVPYLKFICFINKYRFNYGLEESIIIAKREFFRSKKDISNLK